MFTQPATIHYKTNGREGYTKCGINTKSGLLIADGSLYITFKLSEAKCLAVVKQESKGMNLKICLQVFTFSAFYSTMVV